MVVYFVIYDVFTRKLLFFGERAVEPEFVKKRLILEVHMSTQMFRGRAFESFAVGSSVLVVTCPVLAADVLKKYLTPERYQRVREQYLGVMDGLAANERQGVLVGTVTQVGELSPLGLETVEAADGEVVFETTSAFEKAYTLLAAVIERNPNARKFANPGQSMDALFMRSYGDEGELEKQRPWTRFVELSDDERAGLSMISTQQGSAVALMMAFTDPKFKKEFGQLLEGAEDDAAVDARMSALQGKIMRPASDRLYLVLTDNEINRAMLGEMFRANFERVTGQFAAQAALIERVEHRSF